MIGYSTLSQYYGATPCVDVTSDYPWGKARDAQVSDDVRATPLTTDFINDWWGFQQSVAAKVGVGGAAGYANGIVDSVSNPDLLKRLIYQLQHTLLPQMVPGRYAGLPDFDAQGSGRLLQYPLPWCGDANGWSTTTDASNRQVLMQTGLSNPFLTVEVNLPFVGRHLAAVVLLFRHPSKNDATTTPYRPTVTVAEKRLPVLTPATSSTSYLIHGPVGYFDPPAGLRSQTLTPSPSDVSQATYQNGVSYRLDFTSDPIPIKLGTSTVITINGEGLTGLAGLVLHSIQLEIANKLYPFF